MGTDFLSPRTRLQAKAQVNQILYGKYKLDHVLAVAHVANGKVHADIDSKNQYLTGLVSLDALTNSKKLEATLVADVRDVNLYSLEVTKGPMRLSLCGHMDIRSDLKDSHDIMASMSDITVRTAEKNYRPVGVDADVFTRRDTTHAVIDCGDFHLNMDVHGGYKQLMSRLPDCRKNWLISLGTIISIR